MLDPHERSFYTERIRDQIWIRITGVNRKATVVSSIYIVNQNVAPNPGHQDAYST